VVEEALYARQRHWDIIAPIDNFFSQFNREYAKYFITTRQTRQITARTLWEDKTGGRNLSHEEIKARNPRYLPINMKVKFKTVIIIFDDKVAHITSTKEMSAVLIQSQEVSDTMRAMFDGLWEVSREYK